MWLCAAQCKHLETCLHWRSKPRPRTVRWTSYCAVWQCSNHGCLVPKELWLPDVPLDRQGQPLPAISPGRVAYRQAPMPPSRGSEHRFCCVPRPWARLVMSPRGTHRVPVWAGHGPKKHLDIVVPVFVACTGTCTTMQLPPWANSFPSVPAVCPNCCSFSSPPSASRRRQ